MPEGIVWSAIASRYKTRYVNESFRIYHASEDALSRPSSIQNQAEGLALWAREVPAHDVRYFRHDPVWFLRMAANYTRFHRHMALGRGRNWPLVRLARTSPRVSDVARRLRSVSEGRTAPLNQSPWRRSASRSR